MSIQDLLMYGGGAAFVLLSIVEIAPIKINPWSALAKWLGRAFNAEVIKTMNEIKESQKETSEKLENHIKADDQREADKCRARILKFNNELLRGIPHTKEDFIEALKDIDDYERYCKEHKDYENGRAVHAIANIDRIYDDRLKKNDFLT